jgi:cardiolipin synthase
MSDDESRLLTIPNLISASRLLGVPFFFHAITERSYGLALAFVIYAGFSDWADGKIARSLHQCSKLGERLDPLADRLYIASTIIGLAIIDVVPWWLVMAILARDAVMFVYLLWLRTRDITGVPVHYIGKAATMLLLYAFPVLILGEAVPALQDVCRAFGWAFGLWGLGMYWYAALLYWNEREDIES